MMNNKFKVGDRIIYKQQPDLYIEAVVLSLNPYPWYFNEPHVYFSFKYGATSALESSMDYDPIILTPLYNAMREEN